MTSFSSSAAPLSSPVSSSNLSLPDGLYEFLESAGWGGVEIDPIPGDASFRRYFRIYDRAAEGGRGAILMYAPPPREDPGPFLHVARWLSENGLRAPRIFDQDNVRGWVLLEDFGNERMRDWLDKHPHDEELVYQIAVDTLTNLHRKPAGPFRPYSTSTYLREADLFIDWFAPAAGLEVDKASWREAWQQALEPVLERQQNPVSVLRDYHAENIMLLGPQSGGNEQGLIDFQDALSGHRAYDLVSLLQDARRDVSLDLEQKMLDLYVEASGMADKPSERAAFMADYATLGAQRNAKIVGIFVRLWKRDGKPTYLSMVPRVWEAMERDLRHSALAPVARWFEANVPSEVRAEYGGLPR